MSAATLSDLMKSHSATPGLALIEAKSLTRHYTVPRRLFSPPTVVKALQDVSFSLNAGRTLAVVGESGCGKSTLARQVTLIEKPTSGTLLLEGENLTSADAKARAKARHRVQIIFQDPYGSLNPRKKVRAILEEPLIINTRLSSSERAERIHWMMERVGLRPEFATRYPHMFSGGQRQRIAIARALMLNPGIVVADEPVSALDVSVQAQVLNLLMDLQEDLGVAYLFISHDLSVVRHIANDLMVMYLGRAVEQGDKETIFETPAHPYTQALLAATPHINPSKRMARFRLRGELPSPLNPPPGCAFNTRCPYISDRCRTEAPTLRPVQGRQVACHRVEEILQGLAPNSL